MKHFKKLIAVCVFIVVLVIFIIGFFTFFFDVNQLKPILTAEITKRTGYDIVLDGKLSWSFYPRVGVKVGHMSLRIPKHSAPFIDLRDMAIATDLRQLFAGIEKLRGDVSVGEMRLINLQLQNVRVSLNWQNNMLIMRAITAVLYSGTLTGNAEGSALTTMANWNWDMQVKNAQLQPMLEDVNGKNSKIQISGIGQITSKGSTQGNNREQLLANLAGITEFSVMDGTIAGIDLNYLVESANAFINKQPMSGLTNLNKTIFNKLTGTAVIKQGIATIDNFVVTSANFAVKGSGVIDLARQGIDYRLQVTPVAAVKTNWAIPVLVQGRLHEPMVRLDLMTLETMVARDQLKKIGARLGDEIRQLPQKADQLMRELLGE